MRCLIVAMLGLALAGCLTSPDEELRARQHETCKAKGLNPGSDAYVKCRLQLVEPGATVRP